jgi:hypothetical protein
LRRILHPKGVSSNGLKGGGPTLTTYHMSSIWKNGAFKHLFMPPFAHSIEFMIGITTYIYLDDLPTCDPLKLILWLVLVLLGKVNGDEFGVFK